MESYRDIESYRNRYKDIRGKSDSMYIYVLYECSHDNIKDHVKKQLEIVDRVSDSFKRKTFSSRYFLLRELIEQNKDTHVYNCVIFINDDINEHCLTNENKQILKRFNHKNISYVYDDHFDLNYLDDMIFNNDPYHMFRVNNNKIDYMCLTKTKKVIVLSKESKPLDIIEFVNESLPPNSKYMICGVSSKLKEISDPRAYAVINKIIKDDDLIEMIERIDQEDMLIELVNDLAMMTDSKQINRLVFKKEIPSKIKNAQLQKLYINIKFVEKFLDGIKKNGIDVNFKMIVIDTSIKSFVDGNEFLLDQYDGVIGITYY